MEWNAGRYRSNPWNDSRQGPPPRTARIAMGRELRGINGAQTPQVLRRPLSAGPPFDAASRRLVSQEPGRCIEGRR